MRTCACFYLLFYSILVIVIKPCSLQYFEPPEDNDTWIPRVVNGRPAKLGEVPYQVALRHIMSRVLRMYNTYCGGVIIAQRMLLSAAHCFQSLKSGTPNPLSIIITGKPLCGKYAVAGTLLSKELYRPNKTGTAQWRQLQMVAYPAKYNFPAYDICVVALETPFMFDDYIAPIPLASKDMEYRDECLLSGYGSLSHWFTKIKLKSKGLMIAHLPMIRKEICNRNHGKNMNYFICTSSEGASSAKGDSGSPLVCTNTGDPRDKGRGVLVGIVSGAGNRGAAFFTRVSAFSEYIHEILLYPQHIHPPTNITGRKLEHRTSITEQSFNRSISNRQNILVILFSFSYVTFYFSMFYW